MNGKFARTMTIAAAVSALSAGAVLFAGTAFGDERHDNNEHNDGDIGYKRVYDHNHNGGDGANGGRNRAECLVPLGLSLGAVAGSGSDVAQCNSKGGNGGGGGAGDVNYGD